MFYKTILGDELLVGLDGLVGEVTADETLHVEDGVGRVDSGLILRGISDETVAVLHEGDVGGGDTVTLVVGNDLDAAVLENTDAGVGRAKVDADDGAHGRLGLISRHGREGQGQGGHCSILGNKEDR